MGVLVLLWVLLLGRGIWCLWGPSEVSVRTGGHLTVRCVYDDGFQDYIKYWCKGPSFKSCDVQIKTEGSREVSSGRLTIKDSPASRSFTVTMKDVRRFDDDTYYCGIERNLGDNSHMLTVDVLPGVCRKAPPWTHMVDFPENFTEIAVNSSVVVPCQQGYREQNITLRCREESVQFLLSPADGHGSCVDNESPSLVRSLLTSSLGFVVPFLVKLLLLLVILVWKTSWMVNKRLGIYRKEDDRRRSLEGRSMGIHWKKPEHISPQRAEVLDIYENLKDEVYIYPARK